MSYPGSNYKFRALQDLGKIYLRKGDLASAKNYFEQISNDPKAPTQLKTFADYQLAKIDFFKGDFAKANDKLSFDLNDLKDNYANEKAIDLFQRVLSHRWLPKISAAMRAYPRAARTTSCAS